MQHVLSPLPFLLLLIACGDSSNTANSDAAPDLGDGGDSKVDANPSDCEAPDMLFTLDRTMSMHRRPDASIPPNTPEGHAETKWNIAISSIEKVSADLDGTIRFGLALFPRDPGEDACVTLSQRIGGTTATNPKCEAGEVLITPAANTSSQIASSLDPETVRLCRTTPIGAGLTSAAAELARIKDPARSQYAMLLTDGEDTCDEDLAIDTAAAIADSGATLYVIGFDSSGAGIDNGLLNDLACAGASAPDPATNCTDDGNGRQLATNRNGPPLYLLASDGPGLEAAIQDIAGEVCCGCIE